MINPEVLITLLQSKGPSVPTQLKKDVGIDSLLISAMLSNLVSSKKVKLSHLKFGTSPLYYLPGQEDKLVDFIGKLTEKEQRAVAKLREVLILRDKDLDPVTRHCLGQAKDFAEALTVTLDNQKEIFWKWYLATDAETESGIRSILRPEPLEDIPQPVVVPEPPKVELPKAKVEEVVTEKEVPKIEKKPSPVGKAVKALRDFIAPERVGFVPNSDWMSDPFYAQIVGFFQGNGIKIDSEDCIRRKAEYDFTISIDSPVGPLMYYCKAKSKKKLNEGDLSTFFLKAQSKKMPVLLLSTGELSKKAQELLDSELQGLTVKKI